MFPQFTHVVGKIEINTAIFSPTRFFEDITKSTIFKKTFQNLLFLLKLSS